ncbi:UvrD-helicase domain-containing protein [Paenibacillus vini]|uniref:DNA 3'-5' helicase n=1 Tax=Paenibacillus vini TaxID=1476024 RepID=A0ABQ4MAA3_9BACL|nr:UvrD-helicase domain-containing protein [Paenibacillus vini]GIP52924.1 hypothetical protein J42TS3_19590 [Paenibacillus vini]
MQNWISNISMYFKKRKARTVVKKVDSFLIQMQVKYKNSALESNKAMNQPHYTPNSYFQKRIERLDVDRIYLEDGNPIRISSDFELRYVRLMPVIFSLSEYDELLGRYISIQTEFNAQYATTQAYASEMRTLVQRNNELLQRFFSELAELQQDYISDSSKKTFMTRYREPFLFYQNAVQGEIEDPLAIEYLSVVRDIDKNVVNWNQEYIQRELVRNKEFFDNIDGKSLDEQQRIAVLIDEDNNLVLAGAGSGKTLTISGKVKFLTEKKGVSPDDILLISFTNKAAEEMHDRIAKRLHVNVDVKTFHMLGMGIIARNSEKKPDILSDMKPIIQEYFRSVIYSSSKELEKIVTFFGVYLNIPKDLEQFDSLGEYHENQKSLDFETLKGKLQKVTKNLQTLKGETMKSLEETLIANFLFLNGIEYIYEKDYEYPTASKLYRQYKPDFFLPDYEIYIEHFGITEDYRTPWLSSIEEEKYIQGIHWKRALHKEKNTVLVESFSYFNKNGVLFSKLEENLRNKGVQFKKIDVRAVYEAICIREKDYYFEEFIKLVGSFINLFKSNGYRQEHFTQLIEENRQMNSQNTFMRNRNEIFLSLVQPIYEYYQNRLKDQNQIDFNDMINVATDNVKSNFTTFQYKYIIIDEYQDISQSRFQLIKAIKDKTNAKVVCVGDDWQSIYRFAGSDVQLFTKFGEYFGIYELLRIEKTYRNSQQLINVAGKFVMKNTNQLKKNLVSNKNNLQPIRIIGYSQNMYEVLAATIDEIVEKYGAKQSIMLLGRNNFDINFLKEQKEFKVVEGKKLIKVEYMKHKSLDISFMSTHKSKGLEADHVILINAKNSLLGFPNRIADDPVLSWVLTDQDSFDFAEERRLFYVALTRTQNNLYILAPERDASVFVRELINEHHIAFETTFLQNSVLHNPKCLKCKTGLLVERKGQQQKSFLGCSNYPQCDKTYSDVRLLDNQIICSRCNGYMVMRVNNGEEFYGCSNYPNCNNTINIGNKPSRIRR